MSRRANKHAGSSTLEGGLLTTCDKSIENAPRLAEVHKYLVVLFWEGRAFFLPLCSCSFNKPPAHLDERSTCPDKEQGHTLIDPNDGK